MVEKGSATRGDYDTTEFNIFRQFLQEACGIALADNKQYLVSNRIHRILQEHGMEDFSQLVRELKYNRNRRLRDQLIDVMTTNETFWFRDTYPHEYLKSIFLPEMMRLDNGSGPVRIWSAGCSSGQEPCSISITVEEFRRQNMGALRRPVHIVATDLSSIVLEQARKGEYDRLSMARGLSLELLNRYFDNPREDIWRVKPAVRNRIEYKAWNLLAPYAGLGKFDLIFCRNVLIYFNADLKQRILTKLHGALNPRGLLFLGSSEGLAGAAQLYDMLHCHPGIVYRKR